MNTTSVFFISWEMQYNENGHSYGQLVIGSFITTMCPLMFHVSCRVFGKTSNYPGASALLQPRFSNLWLQAFPQSKITFQGKRFQTVNEIQGNTMRQLMAIPRKDIAECFEQWKRCWENCVRSQAVYFEMGWGVIVLCIMFLISCIFFNKCLYISCHMAGYFLDRPHICRTLIYIYIYIICISFISSLFSHMYFKLLLLLWGNHKNMHLDY